MDKHFWRKVLGVLCVGVFLLVHAGYAVEPESQGEPPAPNVTPSVKKCPFDIYLTRNRVCHRCVAEFVDADQVRLTNAQGWRTVVPRQEILGVDNHPRLRRLVFRSLHGIGPSGPALSPYAFQNAQDFLCKYCPNSQ